MQARVNIPAAGDPSTLVEKIASVHRILPEGVLLSEGETYWFVPWRYVVVITDVDPRTPRVAAWTTSKRTF